MFGGVDTAKYHGELASVPVIPLYGDYSEFIVALTGMSVDGTSLSSSLPAPFVLDSGTTLSYLPYDLAFDIYNEVDALYDSDSECAYVECSTKDRNSYIDFTFSGQTISVPFNELVLPQNLTSDDQGTTFQDGTPACIFGIAPAPSSWLLLGDTFLRSAYVVYDLENNEVSLAQTNFNASGQNIREITRSNGVPGATAVSNPITTFAPGPNRVQDGGATLTLGPRPTDLAANAAPVTKRSALMTLTLVVMGMGFMLV